MNSYALLCWGGKGISGMSLDGNDVSLNQSQIGRMKVMDSKSTLAVFGIVGASGVVATMKIRNQ